MQPRNRPTPPASGARTFFPEPLIFADALDASVVALAGADFDLAAAVFSEVPDLLERIVGDLDRLDALLAFCAVGDKRAASRVYDITAEAFWDMVVDQSFTCAVCRAEFCVEGPKMHVDHNHETGDVRGILCGRCNSALGMLQDNPTVVSAALAYLTERGHYGKDDE